MYIQTEALQHISHTGMAGTRYTTAMATGFFSRIPGMQLRAGSAAPYCLSLPAAGHRGGHDGAPEAILSLVQCAAAQDVELLRVIHAEERAAYICTASSKQGGVSRQRR